MTDRTIHVRVHRFDPMTDRDPRFETYTVPLMEGMTVLDVLDHIYEHLDSTLAYYDHAACRQGICVRCALTINGKVALACQSLAESDLTIEPVGKFRVVRDLVYLREPTA